MALSPSHRLGQMIGDELEFALRRPLLTIAKEHGLYLDYKGVRPVRGRKKKVAWKDRYGNTHDLDYVLEDGGSEHALGYPKAFIETAWRRYTKHSRNKAQEIQGAITPLSETYQSHRPFLGAVLAGDFTEGSLDQLRSHNFNLAYCTYETVIEAFASEGIDISSDEDTSQAELQTKVNAFECLTLDQRHRIWDQLLKLRADQFTSFFDSLRISLNRRVEHIVVLTLSGASRSFGSIADAVIFVSGNDELAPASGFVRYEIDVRYSNGDEVRGLFGEKDAALEFLRSFRN